MAVVQGYERPITTRSLAVPGPIVAIEALGSDRITVATARGYRPSLLGRFDPTGESSLQRPPVTGLEVELLDGEPVLSVRDFRVAFGDLEDLPQLLVGNDEIGGGSGSGSNDLYGYAGDDRITGGPGPDILDGGPGIDELRGGAGYDVYTVDRPEDLIEDPDGGQVLLLGKLYVLPEPLDALSIAPGGKAATLIGNGLDNFLYGRGGKDRLEGLAGNDDLEGGSAADTLVGGPGDDLFIVRDRKDLVVELAGEGTDAARATTGWTMSAEVERLEASGRNLELVGNDLANEILVGGVAKSVDGRGGDDTIALGEGKVAILGGPGADRFSWSRLDGAVDTLRDFAPAGGDVLDLAGLLGPDAALDPLAWPRLSPGKGGALLELDPDGPTGGGGWAPLVLLTGIAPGSAALEGLLAAGAIELARADPPRPGRAGRGPRRLLGWQHRERRTG